MPDVTDLEAADAPRGPDAPQVPEDYEGPVVRLAGAGFRMADKVGHLALMRFAKLAKRGVETTDMEGLAGMYDLLEQVVHPDDWGAFEAWADHTRCDTDELLDAVLDALEGATGRPTSRPSGSSDGPPTTRENSAGDYYSAAIADLEARGRPDLAAFVLMQREYDSRVST